MEAPKYDAHSTDPVSTALIIALDITVYDILSLGWRDHVSVFLIVFLCGRRYFRECYGQERFENGNNIVTLYKWTRQNFVCTGVEPMSFWLRDVMQLLNYVIAIKSN